MLRHALVLGSILATLAVARPADACCPAPPSGQAVVNADQTVAIVWDPATKTEHFVRRATWKSDATDFGFLVPSPSQPELAESGDAAFPFLAKLTAPEVKRESRPLGSCLACGTLSRSKSATASAPEHVVVLDQKTVAGFDAVVLEASSASALTTWLKDHGYAYSPDIEAWAKPYVEQKWKITALKVAKRDDAKAQRDVAAASLRLSFHTERPLFPYREPEGMTKAGQAAGGMRLLRIFFVSDARYDGVLTKERAWTGHVAWAGKMTPPDRDKLRTDLGIASSTSDTWLTELEDYWPYQLAPADLYFDKSAKQEDVRRPPIIEYTKREHDEDVALAATFALAAAPLLRRRRR